MDNLIDEQNSNDDIKEETQPQISEVEEIGKDIAYREANDIENGISKLEVEDSDQVDGLSKCFSW